MDLYPGRNMPSSFPPEPPPPPSPPSRYVPQDAGPAFPTGPRPPNVYQQMAKASYIAPVIAFALGCLTRTTVQGYPAMGLVIGGLNVFLIVAGLCLAIIALFGMSKVGREGI